MTTKSRLFGLIHYDLCGPYNNTPSSCDSHYCLTIVDGFSRVVRVYLLKNKIEVSKSFPSFLAMVERQFEISFKIVRSDNGTKFQCMHDYFDEKDISKYIKPTVELSFKLHVLELHNKMVEQNANINTYLMWLVL